MEIFKIIATLCSVVAGDSNSVSSTVAQVEASQRQCHSFYASCLANRNYRKSPEPALTFCMQERENLAKKEQAEWQQKLKQSNKQ